MTTIRVSAFGLALVLALAVSTPLGPMTSAAHTTLSSAPLSTSTPSGPSANFSDAINRLVELVAGAGAGILALVWARVALSWFSNDVTKKVQAKDRARDALIGTLLFTAAISGVVYGLAHWVVTGS
jgi:hypothetical protein